MKLFHRVTLIGVGLIGGSIGRVLKNKRLCDEVVGVGRDLDNLRFAKRNHIIDRFTVDPVKGVKDSDLVVLSLPVKSIVPMIKKIGRYLPEGAVVTDVGSVKGSIVFPAQKILSRDVHFVGGHPVAGTEKSGAASSLPDLFEDRFWILTPTGQTHKPSLDKIKKLWRLAGARVVCLDPHVHDRAMASISHLPHLVAFALVNSLAAGSSGKKELRYSAGGFRDVTRVASSDAAMWREIVEMNKKPLLEYLDAFLELLNRYRSMVSNNRFSQLQNEFRKAKRLRESL